MESLNAESEKTHNTGSQVETNQFSLKLKKLKFDSPSDLNKKERHFSASATENNPNLGVVPTFKINRIYRLNASKRSSPKKTFSRASSLTDISQCPVDGCDSTGNLDCNLSHHHSHDCCPLFYKIKSDSNSLLDFLDEEESSKKCKEKLNKILKNIIYFDEEDTLYKTSSINLNPEIFGNIKNLTTSVLFDSIGADMEPSSLICTKKQKTTENSAKVQLKPPLMNDLTVSRLEFELFQESLTNAGSSTECYKETIIDGEKATCRNTKLKLNTKAHKIIKFGDFEMESWYKSPYPEEFWNLDVIYICQYCLKYLKSNWILNRHLQKCIWKHPPGREIYRKDVYSIFEVDGKLNKVYCQNLCLLARLFLDHKTLYFDVEPFLFYVMTIYNSSNASFELVGYFSKEKQSLKNYNLSCILTLPIYMNKGFGKLLIDFSYLLSRVEGKVGSPEKPLSDLGLISYRNYWTTTLLNKLAKHKNLEISIKDLSTETGILANDIVSTLQYIGLIKYWKGKHVIIRNKSLIDKYVKKKRSMPVEIDSSCLKWINVPHNSQNTEKDLA